MKSKKIGCVIARNKIFSPLLLKRRIKYFFQLWLTTFCLSKCFLLLLFLAFYGKVFSQAPPSLSYAIDTLKTPIALHCNYRFFYHGLPVFNAYQQVHQFLASSVVLSQSNWPAQLYVEKAAPFYNAYFLANDSLLPVYAAHTSNAIQWYNAQGVLIKNSAIGSNYKDTLVKANVFMPNPVNSAGAAHHNRFKDNFDQHSDLFNSEYKKVVLPLSYSHATHNYQPKGKFMLKEISPPYYAPTNWLLLGDSVNRSHPAFEDANAIYHLNLCDSLVQAFGYGVLSDTLYIDTHALNGADQSVFKGVQRPASIEFGTGGVDDAEDGEVIAHEFAHGLSARATHAAPEGLERNCIEEGWADYFAKRYSATFVHNAPNNLVFSWDAHNEFWQGYFIGTSQDYTQDVLSASGTCRQVWSSALQCLYQKLGNYADTLLYEQLFYLHDNITMPQLAETLIQLDSLVSGARHYGAIKSCFVAYGILKEDVRDIAFEDNTEPKLLNSYGFAHAGEALTLQFAQTKMVDMGLYDAQGKLVVERLKQIGNTFSIAAENLGPGLYYLRVYSHTDNQYFTFKLGKGGFGN